MNINMILLLILTALPCAILESCSINDLIQRFNITGFPSGERANDNENVPGAVLSAWAGTESPDSPNFKYRCNIATQKKYCERHGYAYYYLEDSPQKKKERGHVPPHWIKVQSILEVMDKTPRHPWVLYVDSDSLFQEKPSVANHSIESFLNDVHDDGTISLFLPSSHSGWSTDLMLMRNNVWGYNFISKWWRMRKVCPACPSGDQCAGILTLFESLLYDTSESINAGTWEKEPVSLDSVEIGRGKHLPGTQSCCSPRSYCEYPLGPSHPKNPKYSFYSRYLQGCMPDWEKAVHFVNGNNSIRRSAHVSGELNLRDYLGIKHYVKNNKVCVRAVESIHVNGSYEWTGILKDVRA